MDIRNDFKEVQSYFERLLVYANEFYKFQDDWVRLKNDDIYERIYDLPHLDKIRVEKIYSEGRQFGINMQYNLTLFNDVAEFPTLKSYVDHLEHKWLDHLDYINKVLSDVEQACEDLNFHNWNISQMIELHRRQINLFKSLFIWVKQIKKTSLYQSELDAEIADDFTSVNEKKINENKRDLFICHSSKDKINIVEPLLKQLDNKKIKYWYDNAEIKWGDSLIKKVNEGLSISKYVLVIISENFIHKPWPNSEMEAALNLEYSKDVTKVLPLLIGDGTMIAKIKSVYPILNHKLYYKWSEGLSVIIKALKDRLK